MRYILVSCLQKEPSHHLFALQQSNQTTLFILQHHRYLFLQPVITREDQWYQTLEWDLEFPTLHLRESFYIQGFLVGRFRQLHFLVVLLCTHLMGGLTHLAHQDLQAGLLSRQVTPGCKLLLSFHSLYQNIGFLKHFLRKFLYLQLIRLYSHTLQFPFHREALGGQHQLSTWFIPHQECRILYLWDPLFGQGVSLDFRPVILEKPTKYLSHQVTNLMVTNFLVRNP